MGFTLTAEPKGKAEELSALPGGCISAGRMMSGGFASFSSVDKAMRWSLPILNLLMIPSYVSVPSAFLSYD